MSVPGTGPGSPRRPMRAALALAAALVAGSAAGVPLGIAASAQKDVDAAAASTTSTSNPWVPGVGGTLTLGIDEAPTGCNPNTVAGDTWADRLVLEPVLPSAFVVNDDDQAVYDAAVITQAELQSTSPETVVYTINPKAVWSDGTPISASDFVYTWDEERGATGTLGSSSDAGTVAGVSVPSSIPAPSTTLPGATGTTGPAIGYRQIKSVTPSNHGRTVTVVFASPYADWQSLFDDLLPAHVLDKSGWDPSCTSVTPSIDLSGGPFKISKVEPGREVVLTRNPRWWGTQPDLARIVVKIASGAPQLARWLDDGTVDVALSSGFDAQYLENVTAKPALTSQTQLSTTFLQLEFSTTSSVTASVDVRSAIAHAVDRQALIEQVAGWADSVITPAESLIYAQSQGGYPNHKPPPLQVSELPGSTTTTLPATSPTTTPFPPSADPATTDRLLSALGYTRTAGGDWISPEGTALTVRLAVDDADGWASASAPVLEHQLASEGIAVTQVTAASAEDAGIDLSQGTVDMALLPMHSSPYPSQAISWYTPLAGTAGTGGSQDWSNLDDTSVNSLLEKAAAELNPVTAAPIYEQAESVLWQDMVALPLFTEPSVLVWSDMTAGVSPNPDGPSLLWSPLDWSIRVAPTSPDTAPGG